jgi:hypothetical protein
MAECFVCESSTVEVLPCEKCGRLVCSRCGWTTIVAPAVRWCDACIWLIGFADDLVSPDAVKPPEWGGDPF